MKYVKTCTIDSMLTLWGNPFMIFTGFLPFYPYADFGGQIR